MTKIEHPLGEVIELNYEQGGYTYVYYDSSYYQGGLARIDLINIFADIKGDKKADGAYGIKGMLKKITYPTGGNNELFYEPHAYFGEKVTYPLKKYETVLVETDDNGFGSTKSIKIITSATEQKVHINTSVVFNDNDAVCRADQSSYPTHFITAVLKIKDANKELKLR